METRTTNWHAVFSFRLSVALGAYIFLVRGIILNKIYGTHESLYISLFLLTIFCPIFYYWSPLNREVVGLIPRTIFDSKIGLSRKLGALGTLPSVRACLRAHSEPSTIGVKLIFAQKV